MSPQDLETECFCPEIHHGLVESQRCGRFVVDITTAGESQPVAISPPRRCRSIGMDGAGTDG
jgi:hypothetical protein